jgi:hypothetical protein
MADADNYRKVARRLRAHAGMMKSREARADLRWLAAEYEALAAHLIAMPALTEVGGDTKSKRGDLG